MKLATKAQLDRATNAARKVEQLRDILTGDAPISAETWAKVSKEYTDAKAELERASRVLANIGAFNSRGDK